MKTRLLKSITVLILFSVSASLAERISQELNTGFNFKDVNTQEAKFEEYRDIPRGLYLDEYNLGVTENSYGLSLGVKKLRLSDELVKFEYRRNNAMKFSAWSDKTPHNYSFITRTPYSRVADGVYVLSDEFQKNFQNTASTDTTTQNNLLLSLADNTNEADLSVQRQDYGFKLVMPTGNSVKTWIAAERKRRSGAKALGAIFGFNGVVELPEPVDYTTNEFAAGSAINKQSWYAGLDYKYSTFRNDVSTLIWDNPRRLTDSATSSSAYVSGTASKSGQLDLVPDNQAHYASLTGGVNLPFQSRFSASTGYGLLLQSDDFLPYTINSAIIPGAANSPPFDASDRANLPAKNIDAKIATFDQSYTIISNPIKPVDVKLQYRVNQSANKTKQLTFPGWVRLDQVWEGETIANKPFGFRKQNTELDISYDVLSNVQIGAGWGLEIMDRTFREVEESKENTYRTSIIYKPLSSIAWRTDYINAQRKMDDFILDDYENLAGTLIELPGLRRVDVADRDKNRVSTNIEFQPASELWVNLSSHYQTEDFKPGKGDLTGGNATFINRQYGLLDATRKGVTATAEFPVTSFVWLSALYDVQYIKFSERSNVSGATLTQNEADDWMATNRDLIHTVGVDAEFTPSDKLSFGLGYNLSFGKGKIKVTDIASTAAVEVDPPDTSSTLHEIKLSSEYAMGKDLSLVTRYGLELYNVEDFAVGDVPIIGGKSATGTASPNAIYLGDSLKDYKAHIAFVGIKYRW